MKLLLISFSFISLGSGIALANDKPAIDYMAGSTASGVSSGEAGGYVPGFEGGVSSGEADMNDVQYFNPPEFEDCNFDHWVGELVDEDALNQTGRPWRVLGPSDQITMEYMYGRINVIVEKGKVVGVTCG